MLHAMGSGEEPEQEPTADSPEPALPFEAGALAFSADGARLVTGGFDRVVRVWDVASRRELRQVGAEDRIESVSFLPTAS